MTGVTEEPGARRFSAELEPVAAERSRWQRRRRPPGAPATASA